MSFRLKTIVGIALIEIVFLAILVWISLDFLRYSNEEGLQKRALSSAQLFATTTKDAVLSTDLASLETFVDEMLKNPGVVYARVLDDRRVLAERGEKTILARSFQADRQVSDVEDGIYDAFAVIEEEGFEFGRVEIGLTTQPLMALLSKARRQISGIALMEIVLVALCSLFFGTYLTRRLRQLEKAAQDIRSGNKAVHIDVRGKDELARTAEVFNMMSRELQATYRRQQEVLVQAEEASQQILRSEALQRAMLASSLDACITINEHSIILEFNPAAERIFDYPREQVLGQKMTELIIPPSLRLAHRNGMEKWRISGEGKVLGQRIEITAMRRSGEEFPIELAVTPIAVEGQHFFTAFIRDISERKLVEKQLRLAKEQAEAASHAKSQFLTTMSHEIRTPLNAVLGAIGLLEDSKLDHEQQSLTTMAQDAGKSLLNIINDILDFSKIEAGHLELEQSSFKLDDIIDRLTELFMPKLCDKRLKMVSRIDPNVPLNLQGDVAKLQQILMNLLANAIKFTEQGEIVVHVSLEQKNADNSVLRFAVSDTGIGIPVDAQSQLFDEFMQVEQSNTNPYGGTGLGLAISQRLVAMLGGEIGVESLPGKGSLFWFTVSFNDTHDADMLPQRQVQAEDNEFTDGALRSIDPAEARLLLAEDSKANQVIARALLERAGYRVDVVSNGQEAIEAVKNIPYHLVLMDVRMPEMDGIQATRAIRRLPEETGQLPILALTANVVKSDLEICLQAGMNDHITKPIDRKILLEKIAHWLKQGKCAKLLSDQAGAMKNGGTLLDIGILQQLEDDTSAQALIGMLAIFYQETRERLDRLGADGMLAAAELETEAHTLKSSAGSFGAVALQQLATTLEEAVKNKTATHELCHNICALGEQSLAELIRAYPDLSAVLNE